MINKKLLKDAENGDGVAQLKVGLQYEQNEDFENAFKWYTKATESNYKTRDLFKIRFDQSVYRLGLCYLKGIGVRKNSKKALECFKKSAINLALEQIGLMYRDGIGVTKDIERACWHLEKAGDIGLHGDKGIGSALYTVSQIYYANVDTYGKYVICLKKAYDLGDENAISDLSLPVFQWGMGMSFLSPGRMSSGKYTMLIEDDYRQAAHWLKKAAEQGNNDAQYELGVLYFEGNGVLKSKKDCAYWMKKAADGRSLDDINDETLLSYNHAALKAERFWEVNELWKYE